MENLIPATFLGKVIGFYSVTFGFSATISGLMRIHRVLNTHKKFKNL